MNIDFHNLNYTVNKNGDRKQEKLDEINKKMVYLNDKFFLPKYETGIKPRETIREKRGLR